jgi:secretion/DNA translocation related TadE-like protein
VTAHRRVPSSSDRIPPAHRRLRLPSDERGSGTVWVLALAMAVTVVGVAAVAVGAAVVARHRADAAADLAALAAASEAAAGRPAVCRAAERTAVVAGARLLRCAVTPDGIAVVRVAVRPAGSLGRFGAATADARAGRVRP